MKMIIPILIDVKTEDVYCGIGCRFLTPVNSCKLFNKDLTILTQEGVGTFAFRTQECKDKAIQSFEG
jgi:hypothetical protein